MSVLILKPAVDSKGENSITSRLGLERNADMLVKSGDSIEALLAGKPNIHCVLVDEVQFLTPTQIEDLFWYAVRGTVPVLAYGLRTDFSTVGFPGASRLLELAHEIQELKTICRCGKKALLNGRKRKGAFIFTGDQVAIDGEGDIDYESLCGACYLRHKESI